MNSYKYQQIASKALKTMVLMKNDRVASYIPETRWYHDHTLMEMLNKYSFIYIKPDKGTGGGGILSVRRIHVDQVEVCDLYHKKRIPIFQLYGWLRKRLKSSQRYIVQRGIDLANVRGRPFDIRVFMQKPKRYWMISGIAAKIAAPGKIVTNYCKGGRPIEATKALYVATRDHEKVKKITIEIYYLSKEIAKILNRQFAGLRELGIDLGIDKQNKIWIFEVNTQPNFKMFRQLENRQMYHVIRKVHQQIV